MKFRQGSSLVVAWVYAAQGRANDALSVLEQCLADRDPQLIYLKVNPLLETLFPQPRFQSLLRQLRLNNE